MVAVGVVPVDVGDGLPEEDIPREAADGCEVMLTTGPGDEDGMIAAGEGVVGAKSTVPAVVGTIVVSSVWGAEVIGITVETVRGGSVCMVGSAVTGS